MGRRGRGGSRSRGRGRSRSRAHRRHRRHRGRRFGRHGRRSSPNIFMRHWQSIPSETHNSFIFPWGASSKEYSTASFSQHKAKGVLSFSEVRRVMHDLEASTKDFRFNAKGDMLGCWVFLICILLGIIGLVVFMLISTLTMMFIGMGIFFLFLIFGIGFLIFRTCQWQKKVENRTRSIQNQLRRTNQEFGGRVHWSCGVQAEYIKAELGAVDSETEGEIIIVEEEVPIQRDVYGSDSGRSGYSIQEIQTSTRGINTINRKKYKNSGIYQREPSSYLTGRGVPITSFRESLPPAQLPEVSYRESFHPLHLPERSFDEEIQPGVGQRYRNSANTLVNMSLPGVRNPDQINMRTSGQVSGRRRVLN